MVARKMFQDIIYCIIDSGVVQKKNETLLEIFDKVVKYVEPRPIAPLIIDLEKGGLVPNPEYKESNNTKL